MEHDGEDLVECPECMGHCTVECEACGQETDCPTCEGNGTVEAYE